MSFDALLPLADRAALYSALQRDALAARLEPLGERRWRIDLPGTLTFSAAIDPEYTVTAQAELVATIAPAAGTVLWGWAHPQGAGGLGTQLRAHGVEAGIAALSQSEVPFPSGASAEWVDNAAFVIGLAAVDITGRGPQFVAPLHEGTRAVYLLDAGLPTPTVSGAAEALGRILDTTVLRDARTAVWGLGRLAGWSLEWADADFTVARLTDATGTLEVSFASDARIADIRMDNTPSGPGALPGVVPF